MLSHLQPVDQIGEQIDFQVRTLGHVKEGKKDNIMYWNPITVRTLKQQQCTH